MSKSVKINLIAVIDIHKVCNVNTDKSRNYAEA